MPKSMKLYPLINLSKIDTFQIFFQSLQQTYCTEDLSEMMHNVDFKIAQNVRLYSLVELSL